MRRRRFSARIRVSGRNVFLGRWPSRSLAEEASERARRWFVAPRAARADASSPEAIRREARTLRKRRYKSRFFGVSWSSREGRWHASLKVRGKRYRLGLFVDEREAARAYDAVASHLLGASAFLNFQGKVRPVSPTELKKRLRRARKQRATSRYVGVSRDAHKRTRPWLATFAIGKTAYTLGRYATEREAAEAHDRAVRWYEPPSSTLNFPRRRLEPMSLETLRNGLLHEAKKATKSRFIGVFPKGDRFNAKITHECRHFYIGTFDTEEEAARAFDTAALRLRGTRTKLNFDPETGDELRGLRLPAPQPQDLPRQRPQRRGR